MKKLNAKQIVDKAITYTKGNNTLTQSIIEDIRDTIDAEFSTDVIKEIEKRLDSDATTKAERTTLTDFMRKKLQPLIKGKVAQQTLLAENEMFKTHTVTIKKVKSTTPDKEGLEHLAPYVGTYRVIIEPKKVEADKTFEEELAKLMEKHIKTVSDVRTVLDVMAGE